VPFGKAAIRREGNDVTVVAIGRMVKVAMDAAETLGGKGVSVEVIDPRTLQPFDEQTVLDSVRRSGRLAVVDEDYPRCSMATDIAALVTRYAFDHLEAPIRLITPPHTSIPFSPALEKFYIPDEDTVVRTVMSML
jgi:pyruvate dehydrogenase E1 component beta subunit